MAEPIVTSEDTAHEGCPLLTKTRIITTNKGVCSTVEWEVRDKDGQPFDLGNYICETTLDVDGEPDTVEATTDNGNDCGQVLFRFSDAVTPGVIWQVVGYSHDVDAGLVRADLPSDMVQYPGVYLMEIAITKAVSGEQKIIYIDKGILSIERGLFGSTELVTDFLGPPTIQELRIALRDSVTENNLINDVEFDDSELLHAIVRPLRQWNETPPPVAIYDGRSFPWHEHWLRASMALLMRSAAYWYERNRLAATHGGVTVDDRNKMQPYMLMANQLYKEWEEFMLNKKIEINVSLAYGVVSSPYGPNYW